MSKQVKRLYSDFIPSHYVLDLVPDRDAMHFEGSVVIFGEKKGRPSQRLTFHQKDLQITEASVISLGKKGPKEIVVDRINTHKGFDEVRLHTKEMLYAGQYKVHLKFTGTITQPMNGIYPCYFDIKGVKKMLIATQFESHHAREVFPCIDEPEAKATFDLSLTTPKGEAVLANTPIKSQEPNGKLVYTVFETTPKMSTYLLAFVYGELDYKEAKTKDGTLVRTYATPDKAQFTDFALDVAVQCLDFYNDYFGQPYPLEKCDLIALPDFAAGAMENWGCITFREQCMLVDPANTSVGTKQYVAMVVAHELAHQWFGNLVTMRWWTDLWLNEGFASWVEYLAIDHIFPKWQMWTQFIADEQQIAFKLDALENTHPIEVPVHHPDEIRTIFDTISYSKGSSVIHMLEHYLGHGLFQKGLAHYLKKHAYGNTDTVDLWNSLEEVSKKPVKKFMHAWTSQSGFPILNASVKDGKLEATQQRFIISQSKAPKHTWPIPLLSNDTSLKDAVLDGVENKYPIKSKDLLLNQERSGFYRVVYDSEHVARLAKQVEQGKLSVLDRLGLLSDVFESAKAGFGSTIDALTLLSAYKNEDNAAVWDIISGQVAELRGVMDDEDLREAMKPYIRELVAPQLKRLGWEAKKNEDYFDTLLRPTILGMAAVADEPDVVKKTQTLFKQMKKTEDLQPDLRGVIYTTVARNGDKTAFDKLLALHNSTQNSEERTTLTVALTSFKQPELIERALDLIDSNQVRLQDVSYWVAYSLMNRFARDKAWIWIKDHWKWLDSKLGSDLSFYRFPVYVGRSFSDRAFLESYLSFFNKVMAPGLERSVKQGQEMIEWHADWKDRDLKAVSKFFKVKS
jgi:puromycin-sensitive aminopeptidase